MGNAAKRGIGRVGWWARGVSVAVALLVAASAAGEERTLAAGHRYEAGWLQKLLLGPGYRELWAARIRVEVLDLASWSGGLVAEKKGGGKQTKGLKLKGKDGREWRFRSMDKDPTAVLPEVLQETLAARIVQDQISASHPAAFTVVDPLSEAAGIPHVQHRIVVLPDDERLGEFRKEFAGMLGSLEEDLSVKPPVTPGFSGFDRIVDTDELEQILDADSGERVDSAAFLRARLFDILIGDSDRHRGQWDWARDKSSGRFVPVPTDRDLAFVRFHGLIVPFVRSRVLQLMKFENKYAAPVTFHWQARFLDRRYLADLDWPAWRQAAEELRSRLSDAVIDDAVKQLPPPYFRLDGPTLAARLKARRDGLETFARRFYELLAREAEVHATDGPDSVQLLREAEGAVEIVLAGAKGPYFRRRFLAAETEEIRVFLKDGDDRVRAEGKGSSQPTVRLIGGDGNDDVDDSAAGHARFYDSSGNNRLVKGPGTSFSDTPYSPPMDRDGNPERDWGSQTFLFPWFRANRDYGLVLGAHWERNGFAFRTYPFGDRHTVRAGYSTGLQTGGVEYEYLSRRTDNRTRFQVSARASALDIIHYYGFGNETQNLGPQRFYDVIVMQYLFAPSYRLELAPVDVSLGPVLKYSDTRGSFSTLLGEQRPYGYDRFGQLGARLRVAVDRRELKGGSSRGGMLAVEASAYPGVWSVSDSFGKLGVEGVKFLAFDLPLAPTLALRAGGERLFGRYPFQEAASLGGSVSLRGALRQRYIGDSSVYGNGELRLLLVRRDRAVIPRLGIFGLGDVGRVFLEGESSDRLHTAVGGGIFVSVAEAKNVFSIALARSEGRSRFYLQGGFTF